MTEVMSWEATFDAPVEVALVGPVLTLTAETHLYWYGGSCVIVQGDDHETSIVGIGKPLRMSKHDRCSEE